MDIDAVIMMIVALVTVWGGLLGAVLHLMRHPEDTSE